LISKRTDAVLEPGLEVVGGLAMQDRVRGGEDMKISMARSAIASPVPLAIARPALVIVLLALAEIILLAIPAPALADGNASPRLYLEMYDFTSDPAPVPDSVCTCPIVPPGPIQCFADKSPDLAFGLVPIHIGQVENGFLGLPFGIIDTGGDAIFLAVVACPGFLRGPTTAGEPEAIIISSTGACHQWRSHVGYLKYLAPNTTATFFDIVPSADLGHNMVINCDGEYDSGTVIGGGAQWGGTKSVSCQGGDTFIQLKTWGKIKELFR
jgi:hypothetical protein